MARVPVTPAEHPSPAVRIAARLDEQAARMDALERENAALRAAAQARQPAAPEFTQQRSVTLRTTGGDFDPRRQTARRDPAKAEEMWKLRDGSSYMSSGSGVRQQSSQVRPDVPELGSERIF
jgi:hypothetical protein